MSMPPLPPGVSAPSREEERRSRDRLPRPALSYSTLHRAKEALCIAAGDAEWLKPSALALEACGESRLHLVSLLCSACSTFVLAPPRPWRGLMFATAHGERAPFTRICVLNAVFTFISEAAHSNEQRKHDRGSRSSAARSGQRHAGSAREGVRRVHRRYPGPSVYSYKQQGARVRL